jgi:hypothetical protein
LIITPTFTQGRKEVKKMGMSKNLMIEMYPIAEDEDNRELDDFLTKSQADEQHIHQPANVNELIPF